MYLFDAHNKLCNILAILAVVAGTICCLMGLISVFYYESPAVGLVQIIFGIVIALILVLVFLSAKAEKKGFVGRP